MSVEQAKSKVQRELRRHLSRHTGWISTDNGAFSTENLSGARLKFVLPSSEALGLIEATSNDGACQ